MKDLSRIEIAAMCLQGMLSNPHTVNHADNNPDYYVKIAIRYADTLIDELEGIGVKADVQTDVTNLLSWEAIKPFDKIVSYKAVTDYCVYVVPVDTNTMAYYDLKATGERYFVRQLTTIEMTKEAMEGHALTVKISEEQTD
jgi:hypothetical protein